MTLGNINRADELYVKQSRIVPKEYYKYFLKINWQNDLVGEKEISTFSYSGEMN